MRIGIRFFSFSLSMDLSAACNCRSLHSYKHYSLFPCRFFSYDNSSFSLLNIFRFRLWQYMMCCSLSLIDKSIPGTGHSKPFLAKPGPGLDKEGLSGREAGSGGKPQS
jgi:hypothetical protein